MLGVYAANHQSLARFPLSVFALDVQVLSAYLRPETVNLFSRPGILFAGSESIFQTREIIPGLITSSWRLDPVFWYKIDQSLDLTSRIGLISAGVEVVRCEYALAKSSIVTSAAHKAKVYPYSTFSLTPESQSCLRNGLATDSPPSAVIILADGIFLLCHNAFLSGNIHSNLSSALFGWSAHILNGISNIGVSMVKGSFSKANA